MMDDMHMPQVSVFKHCYDEVLGLRNEVECCGREGEIVRDVSR